MTGNQSRHSFDMHGLFTGGPGACHFLQALSANDFATLSTAVIRVRATQDRRKVPLLTKNAEKYLLFGFFHLIVVAHASRWITMRDTNDVASATPEEKRRLLTPVPRQPANFGCLIGRLTASLQEISTDLASSGLDFQWLHHRPVSLPVAKALAGPLLR